ncbi:MAG: alpha/beta hydrolase [Schlesneria sp.]
MTSPRTQGFVSVRYGGQLFWTSAGSGDPLVLIHGGHFDHRIWEQQIDAFSPYYRVIAYDVRGFGKSSPQLKPHQAHVDLCELLHGLGIAGPVHLVGLSLGGRIAVDFALTFPHLTRSLVLAAPGLSGWNWDRPDWQNVMSAMENLEDKTWARIAVAEAWLASPFIAPAMGQPHLVPKLRRWGRENGDSLFRDDDQFETTLDPPAICRLKEIKVQTLLMIGPRDVLHSHQIVSTLNASVSTSIRIDFDKIGHMINLEDPDRFNREVLAFLKTVV